MSPLIKAQDPDILCLNELGKRTSRMGKEKLVELATPGHVSPITSCPIRRRKVMEMASCRNIPLSLRAETDLLQTLPGRRKLSVQ